MPFYVYTCPRCRRTAEELRHVEERSRPLPCSCAPRAKKVLQVTPVVGIVKNPAVSRSKS